MVYNFFDKNSFGSVIKVEITSYKYLPGLLHNPVIRKFEKRKVYPSFKDNIWGTDLADMQLITTYNKRPRFFIIFY